MFSPSRLWGVVQGDCSVAYRLGTLEWAMRVSDDHLRTVLFVGFRLPDGRAIIGGTAFLVESGDPRGVLVVTALHNINLIRHFAPGRPIVLWGNRRGALVPIETDPERWLGHPTDPAVDAAVLKDPLPLIGLDHRVIWRAAFVNDEFLATQDVGIGDELYFPGLFVPRPGAKVRPIMRQGTLAALAGEPITTELGSVSAHLAEVRSIGGFSGSPAWVHLDMWRVGPNWTDTDIEQRVDDLVGDAFLGIVHGHYDTEATLSGQAMNLEQVNMGIAVIIPASRVLEVIDQPEIVIARDKSREDQEKVGVTPDATPTVDFVGVMDPSIARTADLLADLLQVPKDEAEGT